jgi:hypothetical protein
MPNSWRKVTRLTAAEETAFLQKNLDIVEWIIKASGEPFGGWFVLGANIRRTLSMTRVYRELAGEDVFHRIIMINSETPDFTDQWEIAFLQALLYEHNGNNMLMAMGTYNSSDGVSTRCVSLDIVQSGNKGKGILITELRYRRDSYQKTFELLKGQIEGTVDARYVYTSEIVSFLEKTNAPSMRGLDIFTYRDLPYIRISASSCLVDPNIPLRYSLQNAFDGDPATSYVENTEDDLMEFNFTYAGFENIKQMAIINGYAQNQQLYKMNNRIRSIGIETLLWNTDKNYLEYVLNNEVVLLDNYPAYQFFDLISPSKIKINDIYAGTRYNDTCIAELNIKTNDGWLFGDIDE